MTNFKEKKSQIIAIGELNVDQIFGSMQSLPSLGSEVIANEYSLTLGSSTAIFACGMAKLGADVCLIGMVGKDLFGDFVSTELKSCGVDISHIIVDSEARTGVTMALSFPKDRALVTYQGAMSKLRSKDIDRSWLGRDGHIHVSSYFLQSGLQEGLLELFKDAKRKKLTTSLDTGWDPQGRWEADWDRLFDLVDYFLPNEEEAKAITKTDNVYDAVDILSKKTKAVVIKRGEKGSLAKLRDVIWEAPAMPIEVIDTTGAGDSFNAGFIYARKIASLSMSETLRFANICGALSTRGLGGTIAQPNLQEVKDMLVTLPS